MLKVAVFLLAISEFFFMAADSFAVLLGLRLFQGMLVPAMLTALMTYVSIETEASQLRKTMALYIASTIVGGLLGRLMSGTIATMFGWRYSFLLLGISLLIGFFLLGKLKPGKKPQTVRPKADLIFKTLRQKNFLKIYVTVFCFFFVFAAIMNFLPFRVTELDSGASEMRIGFMYSGYALGVFSAIYSVQIADRIGGTLRAMAIGLLFFGIALTGMIVPDILILFVFMFLFCGSLFLVHSVASGHVNSLATENKGMVNGLYVAFYYCGGMFGSSLPGFAYRAYGWPVFILILLAIVIFGLITVLSLLGERQTAGS
jgi:YNFM family putative membrane transporter